MRLHRFLVPLAAGVVVLGVFVAVAIALGQKRGGWTELSELVSIKNQAESLAIDGKLPEAHAKYRELFARAQGHDIKDPAYWDLMERAKLDQDRIYMILLAQQDPARVLTPPLPNSTPSTGATSPSPDAVKNEAANKASAARQGTSMRSGKSMTPRRQLGPIYHAST